MNARNCLERCKYVSGLVRTIVHSLSLVDLDFYFTVLIFIFFKVSYAEIFMQLDEWWEQPASTVVDWVTVDGQNVAAWHNHVKKLLAFYDKELL